MIDWLYNFRIWKSFSTIGNFKIHKGMNEKIEVCLSFLKSNLRLDDEVYVSGHSLGGALSYLAAYALKSQLNTNIVGVYTFGAPRVGGSDWKEAYDTLLYDKTFSYQNNGDYISTLPPAFLGYCNVGQQIKLQNSNRLFPSSAHLPWFYVMNLR